MSRMILLSHNVVIIKKEFTEYELESSRDLAEI